MKRFAALLLASPAVAGDPSTFDGVVQQQKVLPPGGWSGDRFGVDVALDDDTAVVSSQENTGSKEGAVYVYVRSPGGWALQQRIQPADIAPQDFFGTHVTLYGDTLVAGAPADDNAGGADAGSAYVYVRSGTSWSQEAKLLPTDSQPGLIFGDSVDLDWNRLVVGATDFNGRGVAYVFDRQGTAWTQSARLEPSFGGGPILAFGARSKVVGSTVVVSEPLTSRVVVFEETGSGWVESQVIADTAVNLMGAGLELDESAETIFAGAPWDSGAVTQGGAVFVYDRTASGWTLRQKLVPNDVFSVGHFGESIAVSGRTLVVGTSVNDNTSLVGNAYVFREIGGLWCEVGQFTADDITSGGNYARAIDLVDGTVLAGALSAAGVTFTGAAYFHVLAFSPETYCTGKTTSAGCAPAIDTGGSPTWDGPDDFLLLTRDGMPQKPGLFFWGTNGRAALPFLGGTLCLWPPLVRTPVQLSSGTPPCDGGYAFFFSQSYMASAGLDPGDLVNGQFWMRDPQHPDGTGVALSDAVEFGIQLTPPGVDTR